MSDVNFPSTKDVYDTLKNTTKLVEDRNALIKFYFQEDVYKDFLLAERLQDLAAVEKRDDSTRQRSVNLDKKEVVQQATYFKRFSNFLNPSDLPMGDLDPLPPIEFDDDVNLDSALDVDGKIEEEKQKQKGGTIFDVIANLLPGGKNKGGGTTTKAAYGASVTPTSPMIPPVPTMGGAITQNIFNSPGSTPKTQSLEQAGFEQGIQKNIEDKFDEDLGIDPKLKTALAKAMALPLQVVAGGLMKLMAMMPISSNEQRQDLNKSIAFISNAFGVPASSLETVPTDPRVLQQGSKDAPNAPAAPSSGRSLPSPSGGGANTPGGGGFKWNKPETWGKLFGGGGPGEVGGNYRTGLPVNVSNSFGSQNLSNMLATSTSHMSGSSLSSSSLSSTENKSSMDYNNFSSTANTFTSVLNSLLGGQSNITASLSGGNAHIHAVLANNVTNNVQENKADLLQLTNNLETQIAERRKEQTTGMAQLFGQPSMGMPASPPSGVTSGSLDTGSSRAGIEDEEPSSFFELYASTNQYV